MDRYFQMLQRWGGMTDTDGSGYQPWELWVVVEVAMLSLEEEARTVR